MFREVRVPILGIVENMSYFQCPNCGHKSQIFSANGGSVLADKLGVPLLGTIPLTEEIQRGSDTGQPVAVNNEDSVYRKAFETIAGNLGKLISIRNS
jgi:ATP-binding protein involved in chromosome partitioning